MHANRFSTPENICAVKLYPSRTRTSTKDTKAENFNQGGKGVWETSEGDGDLELFSSSSKSICRFLQTWQDPTHRATSWTSLPLRSTNVLPAGLDMEDTERTDLFAFLQLTVWRRHRQQLRRQ